MISYTILLQLIGKQLNWYLQTQLSVYITRGTAPHTLDIMIATNLSGYFLLSHTIRSQTVHRHSSDNDDQLYECHPICKEWTEIK